MDERGLAVFVRGGQIGGSCAPAWPEGAQAGARTNARRRLRATRTLCHGPGRAAPPGTKATTLHPFTPPPVVLIATERVSPRCGGRKSRSGAPGRAPRRPQAGVGRAGRGGAVGKTGGLLAAGGACGVRNTPSGRPEWQLRCPQWVCVLRGASINLRSGVAQAAHRGLCCTSSTVWGQPWVHSINR